MRRLISTYPAASLGFVLLLGTGLIFAAMSHWTHLVLSLLGPLLGWLFGRVHRWLNRKTDNRLLETLGGATLNLSLGIGLGGVLILGISLVAWWPFEETLTRLDQMWDTSENLLGNLLLSLVLILGPVMVGLALTGQLLLTALLFSLIYPWRDKLRPPG